MSETLTKDEHSKAREAIMTHVRKVVPYALMVAVASGLYLISQTFGVIENGEVSNFQILLSIKAFLASWLGLRGINQKLFKIQPFLFKSHLFPFTLVMIIILLSQFMFIF